MRPNDQRAKLDHYHAQDPKTDFLFVALFALLVLGIVLSYLFVPWRHVVEWLRG